MDTVSPFAVAAGDGSAVRAPTGDRMTIKAGAGSTGSAFTVLEIEPASMHGPALHVHHREDELWYVLEGDFRFLVGEQLYRLSSGGMAFGPREVAHCFQNIGDRAGRLLIVFSPAGLERFFEEFAAGYPTARAAEGEYLNQVGHAHGLDFIGPPLTASHPL